MSRRWGAVPCVPQFSSMASLMCTVQHMDSVWAIPVAIEEPPLASPPEGMSLSVLPTGHIESRAALAFSGGGWLDTRQFALCALLVRHPQGDLLFDAGIGAHGARHRALLPWLMRQTTTVHAGTPAAQQLAAHHYPPERLAGIVLTHSHWDHISGAEDFPDVPVWVSADEVAFMHSAHRSTAVARSLTGLRYLPYEFERRPYLGFASHRDVWGDGSVVLVPAPGHTPGSVIAFLALPSGRRIALIGDIVWQIEGLEREVPKPWLSRMMADASPSEVLGLVHTLAHLYRTLPDMQWVPSHDARAMASLPTWPASLA
jgi:N-acyl homoserine lactone hydrolase